MIIDADATAAFLLGSAIGTLVTIIDADARTTFLFCHAPRAQVTIIDAGATAAALLGIAVGTLVKIIDAGARTTFLFCAAPRAQVMIIDAGATAAFLHGRAIGTLVMVIDAVATGKRVTAEHQQHCKNQFHFTLPWAYQRNSLTLTDSSSLNIRHYIKLTSLYRLSYQCLRFRAASGRRPAPKSTGRYASS
ncbi:hypothetical protein KXJ79_22865 [Pseudomonas amygdali]|nr:hypothetical protein KXJ79_22865 [Pseudomonas amygdali]